MPIAVTKAISFRWKRWCRKLTSSLSIRRCLKSGEYKTLHLADEALISRLKPGAILINACRGPVVDNNALLKCLKAGQNLSVVLDVWEPEPDLQR
ncbi:Erythronate-4-phosphate dehydrogenase [Cedecea neteri]|uniref:Erythronate-4-phosphate dehydrogenase n=1 Tax=Cedecea neteri TaxID=158822 RepID=A0A2X3IX12_9ENTR|nr:Erythronate-4-phosphate dehydrogenase [Cedecea neteri]